MEFEQGKTYHVLKGKSYDALTVTEVRPGLCVCTDQYGKRHEVRQYKIDEWADGGKILSKADVLRKLIEAAKRELAEARRMVAGCQKEIEFLDKQLREEMAERLIGELVEEEAADQAVGTRETVTVKELRKRLKAAGFKLKTESLSFGLSGSVLNAEGQKMPSIFTSETMPQWQPALDIVKNLKVVTDSTDKVYGPWSK